MREMERPTIPVRKFHASRPLSKRIIDEKRFERLTKNVEEWMKDPDKWDFGCIDAPAKKDTGVEEKFKYKKTRDGIHEIDFVGKAVEWIMTQSSKENTLVPVMSGYIKMKEKAPNLTYVEEICVYPESRGKCLGELLFRRAIELLDLNCSNAMLIASPFECGNNPFGLTRQQMQRYLDKLVEWYGAFGFEYRRRMKHPYLDGVEGVLMYRKNRCGLPFKLMDEEDEEIEITPFD